MINCLTQKIELNSLIPAIRKGFAGILEKKGQKDTDIAKLLGITKAAISQYKSRKRGKTLDFPEKIKNKIKISAGLIMKGRSADKETNKIISEIKKMRYICKLCRGCK